MTIAATTPRAQPDEEQQPEARRDEHRGRAALGAPAPAVTALLLGDRDRLGATVDPGQEREQPARARARDRRRRPRTRPPPAATETRPPAGATR